MEKIRLGIIGLGGIARTMARTVSQMSDAVLYAVASRSEKKAADFAKEFGAEKHYGSYAELIADKDVDLIYVATPHSEHFENAKACIEGKKNVLLEKAFTTNAEQARQLISLAKDAGVLLTEAMWVRYVPLCKELRRVLADGAIGRPYMCTANLHYVIDTKPRLVDPKLSGGALLDVGVYALTFASIVFGDDIEKITALASLTERGVDRQAVMAIRYKDGRMADLNCGMSALSDRQGIIYGDKGFIIVENINNFEGINIYDLDRRLVRRIPAEKQISGYEYEVLSCKRAIEGGLLECPEMPHEETIRIMEQMDEVRSQIGVNYN